jgi:CHASE3 domain sensor protein
MPKVARADRILDWRQLRQAAAPLADQKELHVHLRKLETAIERFEELEALRADLQARRQRATQELDEVKEAGQMAAVEIRSILKGILGPSNERLVQFNMRPRRAYKRKPAANPDPSSASD